MPKPTELAWLFLLLLAHQACQPPGASDGLLAGHAAADDAPAGLHPFPDGPRTGHATVAWEGRLYVLGGEDRAGGLLGDVLVATLAADGTPGPWRPAAHALAAPRAGHRAFVLDGVLYVAGGTTASGARGDVQASVLDAAGEPGPWGSAALPDGAGGALALLTSPRSSTANAAVKLGLAGLPQTVLLNTCSAGFQVRSLDSLGAPTFVSANTLVSLSATNGALLYTDSSCLAATSSVTLTTGSVDSPSLFLKGATAGTSTITAGAAGLSSATSTATLQGASSGSAVKMSIANFATTYSLGSFVTFTVALQDASNAIAINATNAVTVSLAQNPTGATLSGTTTKNASNGAASFSLSIDKPGTGYQLQAVASPALANNLAVSPGFDVRAGTMGFTSGTVSANVGSCGGPLVLVLKDLAGTQVVAAPSAFNAAVTAPAGVTFYRDADCTQSAQAALPIAAGSLSTSIYFAGTAVGFYNVQVTAAGYGSAFTNVNVTTGGGGGSDGGTDAGGTSDGGDAVDPSHRTINGFACSSGASGGGGAGLGLGLLAALLLLPARRRRGARALLLAAALAALPARAAEEELKQDPLVAVLNFKNKLTEPADQAVFTPTLLGYLPDKVRESIIKTLDTARPMTSENMISLVTAAGKQLEDCEGQCEVDTGRLLGADLVITGDLLKVGSFFKLVLRMHDTRSGVLLSASEAQGRAFEDIERDVRAAVGELFQKHLAARQAGARRELERREALDREAKAKEDARRAEERRAEDARRAAELREKELRDAAARREQQEREARERKEAKEQEVRLAEAQAQRAGVGGFGGVGVYGGFAWDPKAETVGAEAGLKLRLGSGWSLAGGAVIAPKVGGRVALYKTLHNLDNLIVISLGVRGLYTPLPDGPAYGGGAGLRLSFFLARWADLYVWGAGEVYKTKSETLVAPLLASGLELHL